MKPSKLHFSLLVFLVSLLFTVISWDHYFNSNLYYDRYVVSNLVLALGTMLSFAFGLFAWSLESRKATLEKRNIELERANSKIKEAQEELVQAGKLASLGQVVAGIVHELNSPLVTITGFLRIIKEESKASPDRSRFEIIEHQLNHCHNIVRNLLSFSRKKMIVYSKFDLCDLIDEIVKSMCVVFSDEKIDITTLFPDKPSLIEADPEQMRRVLTNLIVNATHALKERKGDRKLTVKVEKLKTNYQIFVQDNGGGIDKENVTKIFDPFFTTKAAGKGTGLGLSLSYGIVSEHGGKISVQSEKGKGTVFLLELPVTRPTSVHDVSEKNSLQIANALKPEVLVVDDDQSVLSFMTDLIKNSGLEVVTAPSGEKAVEIARARMSKIKLLILDVSLSGMDGFKALNAIRQVMKDSTVPAIIVTGKSESEVIKRVESTSNVVCLFKPYDYKNLRSAVNQHLAA